MTQRFEIHPTHPQKRLIAQAAAVLKAGGLIVLPTDACYVLACQLDDKQAVDRLRALRAIDDRHLLTLMCRDLREVAVYAQIDNVFNSDPVITGHTTAFNAANNGTNPTLYDTVGRMFHIGVRINN